MAGRFWSGASVVRFYEFVRSVSVCMMNRCSSPDAHSECRQHDSDHLLLDSRPSQFDQQWNEAVIMSGSDVYVVSLSFYTPKAETTYVFKLLATSGS